jgi:DNA-binding MarR family transcriptional regulator
MAADQHFLVNHILQTAEDIFKLTGPELSEEWLSSDLTVTQLRFLLAMHADGPLRMSDIAAKLKVTLPSATAVVDHLVSKNLVVRQDDPKDRRLVICRLSPAGETLIHKLWVSGRATLASLLEDITLEQAQQAAAVADLLHQQALKIAKTN